MELGVFSFRAGCGVSSIRLPHPGIHNSEAPNLAASPTGGLKSETDETL